MRSECLGVRERGVSEWGKREGIECEREKGVSEWGKREREREG